MPGTCPAIKLHLVPFNNFAMRHRITKFPHYFKFEIFLPQLFHVAVRTDVCHHTWCRDLIMNHSPQAKNDIVHHFLTLTVDISRERGSAFHQSDGAEPLFHLC